MSGSPSHTQEPSAKSGLDTFIILLAVAFAAFLANYLVPLGFFETPEGVSLAPDQYQAIETGKSNIGLFGTNGERGFLNFLFEGLVSGDRNGATVGLMAFILIVGGSFGMIMRTGVIEAALHRGLSRQRGNSATLVPVLFVVFSLCGAVFGMSEEAIVFALITVPALKKAGFDSITGVFVTYVATQIGFATSWMNPFGVVIAQGIADVPALSGMEFRIALWTVFTIFSAMFIARYSAKIKQQPSLSSVYHQDKLSNEATDTGTEVPSFSGQQALLLAVVAAGIAWVIWGVVSEGYYLPEIATQFFAIGLLIALLARLLRISDANSNDYASAFKEGAMQLVPAAMVIGIAKGIIYLLGGDDPSSPSVLNTILWYMSHATADMADWLAAWVMYLLQSGLNFLVVSGSGQAALTMPLMTPLADLSGVSRQTAVLAFQLGDGLTNIICPASAALMGCLGVARIDWLVWAKFILKFQLYLTALASGAMILAVLIGYQ